MSNTIIKKMKKLIKNPNLFFYDLFEKRIGKKRTINFNCPKETALDIDTKLKNIAGYSPIIHNITYSLAQLKNDSLQINDAFDFIDNQNKVIMRSSPYLESYELFFKQLSYITTYSQISRSQSFQNSQVLLVHGQGIDKNRANDISEAVKSNMPVAFCEDGFLHSIVRPADLTYEKKYRMGCSLTADFSAPHFSAAKASSLEKLINSDFEVSDTARQRARKNIDCIIKNYVSKYNNQPIIDINIGTKNKKVLVIDQACNDMSITMGGCSEDTFINMLYDAIRENPDSDILVKVHPDMINNPNRGGVKNKVYGHYTDIDLSEYKNVHIIANYVNPIALLKNIDKVYVATSQMGFEALMCNKEVIIYGVPFYAGWGIGECRSNSPALLRRTRKRTLEEIFYLTYIKYSRYIHPLLLRRCEIEDTIEYIIKTRNSFFQDFKIENTLYEVKSKDSSKTAIVDIAFAFDSNFYKQAIVAILSLLDSKDSSSYTYNIHCVISDDVTSEQKEEIKQYTQGHHSLNKITFYKNPRDYDHGYECRNISNAAYIRLNLHNILKDIDKVIYSDVDVLFNSGMYDAYSTELGSYYMGACIDIGINTKKIFSSCARNLPYWNKYFSNIKGKYFSSGFLLINLAALRKANIDKKWRELASNNFLYQDMDILNMTINNKIYPMHSKYCVIPRYIKSGYETGCNEKFIPQTHLKEIIEKPAIYHFAAKKPWDDKTLVGANIWWEYIKKYTELYSYFSMRYEKISLLKK